jgi:hypothetical protein
MRLGFRDLPDKRVASRRSPALYPLPMPHRSTLHLASHPSDSLIEMHRPKVASMMQG